MAVATNVELGVIAAKCINWLILIIPYFDSIAFARADQGPIASAKTLADSAFHLLENSSPTRE